MSNIYSKYLFTPKQRLSPQELQEAERVPLICTEDNDLLAFRFDSYWYRKPYHIIEGQYALLSDEVYVFMGSDLQHPEKLGAVVSCTIDGKKFSTDQSCVIYFPKFVPHGDLRLEKVERPVFSYSGGMSREIVPIPQDLWERAEPQPEGYYLLSIDQVKTHHLETDEHTQDLLWNCSEGFGGASVYHNIRYFRPYAKPYKWAQHSHAHPMPEIVAFIGCDPEHPYDFGARVDFDMVQERYEINTATVIYAPPYFPHCPLMINQVEQPYFFIAFAPDFPEYIHLYLEKTDH